jgi:hypothetical protein
LGFIGRSAKRDRLPIVFVVVFFREKCRLDFEDALETEGVSPQYLCEVDTTALHSVNRRIGVDVSDTTFDRCEAGLIDKISLVNENDVGKRALFLRFRRPVDLFEEILGICDGDDGVELRLTANVLIGKERLRHRRGICESGGLDDNAVELRLRCISPAMMRIRSPRTVQQMQPWFISKISSSASTMRSPSMPTSPNSFTITLATVR